MTFPSKSSLSLNNPTKAGACLAGGGAIIGGSVAVDKYLLNNESTEEESYSPHVHPVVDTSQAEDVETIEKAFKTMGLTMATDSDFPGIYTDLKTTYGVPSWADSHVGSYGLKASGSNTNTMKNKCKSQLSRKFSDFKDNLKNTEYRTIKLVCTTNYSLNENAKDYLDEGEYIKSKDQQLDDSKWKTKIDKFKSKSGNSGKTFDDMKEKCLEMGKALYRTHRAGDGNDFFEYCTLK